MDFVPLIHLRDNRPKAIFYSHLHGEDGQQSLSWTYDTVPKLEVTSIALCVEAVMSTKTTHLLPKGIPNI